MQLRNSNPHTGLGELSDVRYSEVKELTIRKKEREKKKKKMCSKCAVGVTFIWGGGAGKEHHLLETSYASPDRPSSISLKLKCITHEDLVRALQRTVSTL